MDGRLLADQKSGSVLQRYLVDVSYSLVLMAAFEVEKLQNTIFSGLPSRAEGQ